MRKTQRTLKGPVDFQGAGLFTGVASTMRILPAAANAGITFVRTDLPTQPRIPANYANLTTRSRRTALAEGDAEIETVEHILSALAGLGIDNADIQVSAPEVPHADGSVKPWVDLLLRAGLQDLPDATRVIALREAVAVSDKGGHLVALPSENGLSVDFTLSYPNTAIGTQKLSLKIDEDMYPRELAGARTFCLDSEAEALRAQGLGLGGTTANSLVVGPKGPVENTLRWPDEYVRHKILDLIGDLALLGGSLRAHVIAVGSGHSSNLKLVQRIAEAQDGTSTARRKGSAVLDTRDIEKILPHRYPMLMIDRVIELDGYKRAVGIKNVSYNEPFFQGHFPGQPIMPGVLQIEAMAQLAGTLLMRKSDNLSRTAVLLALDNVKLRRNVMPGDQLRIEVETLKLKSRSAEVHGRATVDGQLACEAELKFMLIEAQL